MFFNVYREGTFFYIQLFQLALASVVLCNICTLLDSAAENVIPLMQPLGSLAWQIKIRDVIFRQTKPHTHM